LSGVALKDETTQDDVLPGSGRPAFLL